VEMKLKKLYLQDFRQFQQKTWQFGDRLNLIIAKNGAGKTTILEAIYLLATARSFRASKTNELIRFDQEIGRAYALIDQDLKLGLTLTHGSLGGKKTAVKHYTVGKAKKRQIDFIGNLLVACFRPEDLRLIEGSSSRRREYLDDPLSITNKNYYQAKKNYQASLIRRNKTLQAIKNGDLTTNSLSYWDQNLLNYGTIIHQARSIFFHFLNHEFESPLSFKANYLHSQVTQARLEQYRVAELAIGHTLIGPHKDDFEIITNFNGHEASLMTYGSRGQHRLAVLWLKLAELSYLEKITNQKPILLLDDIFSELDQEAQALVWNMVNEQQTIITSTDEQWRQQFSFPHVEEISVVQDSQI